MQQEIPIDFGRLYPARSLGVILVIARLRRLENLVIEATRM